MGVGIVLNRSRQVPAEDTPAFGAIAERFRRAGDLARAVALCREGLRKFPDHLSARVTLGWALLDQGQYDDARAELEQVLKRAPDNLAAIRGLAELHDRAENTIELSLSGPGPWPPDPATIDSTTDEPVGSSAPAAADEAAVADPLADLAGAARLLQGADEATEPAAAAELIEPVEVLRAADAYLATSGTAPEAGVESVESLESVETLESVENLASPASAAAAAAPPEIAAEAQDAVAASTFVDEPDLAEQTPQVTALDEASLADSPFAAPDPSIVAETFSDGGALAPLAAMEQPEAEDAIALDADLAVGELEQLLVGAAAAEAPALESDPSLAAQEVVLDADTEAVLDPAAALASDAALEPLLLEPESVAVEAPVALVDLDAAASAVALESLLEPATPVAAEPVIDDEAPLVEQAARSESDLADALAPIAAAEVVDEANAFTLTAPAGPADLSLEAATLALVEAQPAEASPGSLALDFDAEDPEPITPVYLMDADLREAADIREAVELAATFLAPPAPEPVLVAVAPTPEPVSAVPPAPAPENQPAQPAQVSRRKKGEPDPSVRKFEKMLEGIKVRRIQSSAYNLAG
jgi:hypothetical protein